MEATRPCPYCGEAILRVARKCKHCGEFIDGSAGTPKLESQEVKTNVKQGALIGAMVVLVVGLLFMWFSLWSFVIYAPLFLAAFILSIVAMAQRRVLGGIVVLLLTLIVPPILFLVLGLFRTSEALSGIPSQSGLLAAQLNHLQDAQTRRE